MQLKFLCQGFSHDGAKPKFQDAKCHQVDFLHQCLEEHEQLLQGLLGISTVKKHSLIMLWDNENFCIKGFAFYYVLFIC